MAAHDHLEDEFEHHPVHVRGREDGDDPGGAVNHGQVLVHEIDVGPDGPGRDHDALREAGGAGGITQDRQVFGRILVVMEVRGPEPFRVGLLVPALQVRAEEIRIVAPEVEDLVVLDLDDGQEAGHLVGAQAVPDGPFHEEDLRLRMVHQVVDVAGLELMQ